MQTVFSREEWIVFFGNQKISLSDQSEKGEMVHVVFPRGGKKTDHDHQHQNFQFSESHHSVFSGLCQIAEGNYL